MLDRKVGKDTQQMATGKTWTPTTGYQLCGKWLPAQPVSYLASISLSQSLFSMVLLVTVHTGYLVLINMQVYLIYTVIEMTNPEGIYYLLQQQNKILPLRIKIHR